LQLEEETLLEAVDYGLMALGATVRHAIYDHIKETRGLKRADILEHIQAFHEALTTLLGKGAQPIEKVIAKKLYQQLGRTFTPHENWTLASDPIMDEIKNSRPSLSSLTLP